MASLFGNKWASSFFAFFTCSFLMETKITLALQDCQIYMDYVPKYHFQVLAVTKNTCIIIYSKLFKYIINLQNILLKNSFFVQQFQRHKYSLFKYRIVFWYIICETFRNLVGHLFILISLLSPEKQKKVLKKNWFYESGTFQDFWVMYMSYKFLLSQTCFIWDI